MEDNILIKHELIHAFMLQVLNKLTVPPDLAKTTADVLIKADLRGIPSHGIARFKDFYAIKIRDGLINPAAKATIVKNVLATAVVDAQNGLGHPAGKFAMELAIEKAKNFGVGFVTVNHSNHFGIAGHYVEMALKHDMVGIAGTNARPAVAPTRGVEALFGTNPIAVSAPSSGIYPFLFDAATTIAQRGKIETYARRGKKLPPGWVLAKDGRVLTDPKEVLAKLLSNEAALLPLGGHLEEAGSHKGYGLAMVVELFSAAFSQANFLKNLSGIMAGKKVPNGIGHFFGAIRIDCFTEPSTFKQTISEMMHVVRTSERVNCEQEILIAGEKEFRTEQESLEKGIPIDSEVKKDLLFLQKEFSLDSFRFPFES